MKIISNDLITNNQEQMLESLANANFKMEGFRSINDILTTLDINVEIKKGVELITIPESTNKLIEQIRDEINDANNHTSNVGILLHDLEDEYNRYLALKKLLKTGEYIHNLKLIVLYPEAMQKIDSANVDALLQTTFIHEAMHAYFNRDKIRSELPYMLQIEEPMAEFGMLLYLKETNNSLYNWAYKNVKDKNCCYSIGAELMEAHLKDKKDKDETVRILLEAYKTPIEDDNPRVNNADDVLIPCARGAIKSVEVRPITVSVSPLANPTVSLNPTTPCISANLPFGGNPIKEIATWELANQSNPALHFSIPAFQRGYRWDEKQVTDLCEDLQEFISSNDENYYLQPLVVKPSKWTNASEQTIDVWEVLDGQQRLTTMLLLLRCICEMTGKTMPLYEIHYTHRPNLNFGNITFAPGSSGYSYPDEYDNLDSYYVSKAKRVIYDWYNKLNGQIPLELYLLNKPFSNQKKEVKFIWYNVQYSPNPSKLTSLQLFNRLNGGKISLTGSELIKALFYFVIKTIEDAGIAPYSSLNTKSFILEWDSISRQFQNDSFWSFISTKNNQNMQTRMDLLFNTIKQVNGKVSDAAYRKYQNDFKKDVFPNLQNTKLFPVASEKIFTLWKEVRKMYDLLVKWYENVDVYNYVGFMIECGLSPDKIITQVGTSSYSISTLQNIIRSQRWFNGINTSNIDTLTYEKNSTDIRRLLLLFNIETYRCHGLRFPFYQYRAGNWDLEHVNSQTENTIQDPTEKMDWIRNQAVECLSHETDTTAINLYNSGKTYLTNGSISKSDFVDYYSKVVKYYTIDSNPQKDGIDNLTLLNSTINRMYKNALFPSKRLIVTFCDQMGEFIPLCTRYLFLKYYSSGINANRLNMMRWNQDDQKDYLDSIKHILYPIIK